MKSYLLEKLRVLESNGLITLRSNKDNSLFIANYTPKVQYENLWDGGLINRCRGLIVDSEGEIVARPFPKFFNYEEGQVLPNEPFEVFEKADGSLAILHSGNQIATRGSFESEQAVKATEMLNTTYKKFIPTFDANKTYLFEIIYPQNRIVVDYGDQEKLVLLAIIDTQTGCEYDIADFDFPHKVKKFNGIKDIAELKKLENDTDEGFVVKFKSNFRVKIKFSEYLRLHRLLTQVSSKTIWECLRNGTQFDEILDRAPDEFYDWVNKIKRDLEQKFDTIFQSVSNTFKNAPTFSNRKDFADWANHQKYSFLLFSLLDGKNIKDNIWKLIKPKYERPFKAEA